MTSPAEYQLRTDKLQPLSTLWDCEANGGTTAGDDPADASPSSRAPAQPIVLAICGSFNPIHNAHISLYDAAERALRSEDAGGRYHVLGGYMSPVGDQYGKPGLRPFAQRLAVVEAAIRTHAGLQVDCWEGLQPTYTRTLFVLAHLEDAVRSFYESSDPDGVKKLAAYGMHVRVAFVCGADLMQSFTAPGCWPVDLLKRLLDRFLVVGISRRVTGSSSEEAVEKSKDTAAKSTVMKQEINGVMHSVDVSEYRFVYGSFLVPDDSSSTTVRTLLEGSRDCARAREEAVSAIRAMVPADAVESIVKYYGN